MSPKISLENILIEKQTFFLIVSVKIDLDNKNESKD